MPAFLAGMFLFGCQPRNSLAPDDSIKDIKALNSDLANLSSAVKEHPAFTALDFLVNEVSSPLSYLHGMPARFVKDSLPDLNYWKGSYTWNSDSLKFLRTDITDNIIIDFPLRKKEKNDTYLFLNAYKTSPALKLKCFPTEIEASLDYHDKPIMDLSYSAIVEEYWPSKIQMELTGKDFKGEARIERTRKGNEGTIDLRISVSANDYTFLHGSVLYEIGYNNDQFFARMIKPDLTIFDVDIKGYLDYGKVDPTSQDYVKSFNDNCYIAFYDSGSGKKIGDFGLGMDKTGQLLEWVLYLSDGSEASLYENILVFKKFMDYKYPNRQPVI